MESSRPFSCAGGEGFEDGCARFVVGTCDAAGGAGKRDVSDGLAVSDAGEEVLEKGERLRATLRWWSGGLLAKERNCQEKGEKYSGKHSRKAHQDLPDCGSRGTSDEVGANLRQRNPRRVTSVNCLGLD